MDFMLNLPVARPDSLIDHRHKILSVGSCFTEHIVHALQELKFTVLQNPNGILFDPVSVGASLVAYIQNRQYEPEDLFYLNELWHSWQHHSRFSHTDQSIALAQINTSTKAAHAFLKEADWLIITLGSSFSYRLTDLSGQAVKAAAYAPLQTGNVANCHRAPAQWFNKHLLAIDEIVAALDNTIHQLFRFNPGLKIIFTISPVRHIRDGVVENNRSKARLIEAVHHLVNKFDKLYYFPSYEILIDVLRDYRFYAEDMVHPNHAATEFVLEKFTQAFLTETSKALLPALKALAIARRHRTVHPQTEAHRKFLEASLSKALALQKSHPYLDLQEEIAYFGAAGK